MVFLDRWSLFKGVFNTGYTMLVLLSKLYPLCFQKSDSSVTELLFCHGAPIFNHGTCIWLMSHMLACWSNYATDNCTP